MLASNQALLWRSLLIVFVLISDAVVNASEPSGSKVVAGKKLMLNGYGEREIWWTDVYRCALYLPKLSNDLSYIRDHATPKAIIVRVLYGDIPDKIPEDWREIFVEELNRELLGKIRRRFRKLDVGDTLEFTYAKGSGTRVSINGELLFSDEGHGLILGLVDQFLGDPPVSKNLKRLLLGRVR